MYFDAVQVEVIEASQDINITARQKVHSQRNHEWSAAAGLRPYQQRHDKLLQAQEKSEEAHPRVDILQQQLSADEQT